MFAAQKEVEKIIVGRRKVLPEIQLYIRVSIQLWDNFLNYQDALEIKDSERIFILWTIDTYETFFQDAFILALQFVNTNCVFWFYNPTEEVIFRMDKIDKYRQYIQEVLTEFAKPRRLGRGKGQMNETH